MEDFFQHDFGKKAQGSGMLEVVSIATFSALLGL